MQLDTVEPPEGGRMKDWILDALDMAGWGLLIGLVLAIVLAALGLWAYHTWYVDTHCVPIMGVMVCHG